MGWFNTGRGYSSEPRIERIDLAEESSKSFKIKAAAAILLAAAGVLAVAWAVNGLLTKEPGWTEIHANSTDAPACAGDFTLNYNVGADGSSPNEQIKALTVLYTDVSIHAEKLFSASVTDDEIHGLGLLNANVNKPVVLDPEAYDALALLQKNKSREIFLAPVYEQYNTLFFCATDEEAADLDPSSNEEQRAVIEEMLSFCSDPQHIDILLEKDSQATLRISDEYRTYAKENGIETLIDLYWMKNAFAADYMADKISAAGFRDGVISSGDGFTRSLGSSDVSLKSTVYDRVERNIVRAATLRFGSVRSIAIFHDYPLSRNDDRYYYQYSDGRMITPYISLSDGHCRASVSNLTICSDTQGCAAAMLAAKNAYFSKEFPAERLQKKLGDLYSFAFTKDSTVFLSSSGISVEGLLNDGVVVYTARMIETPSENP